MGKKLGIILAVVAVIIIIAFFAIREPSEKEDPEAEFSPELEKVQAAQKDAGIRVNLSQIRSSAEIHYQEEGFAYDGLCENPETETLLQTIANISGADPFCETDKDIYCIHAQLASDPDQYLCVNFIGIFENPCTADLECR